MKANMNLCAALLAAVALCAATTVSAKSWRIHNISTYKPHFTSINASMASDEVQEGDTLYLDPGCTLTDRQTITKRVSVIGPGYFMGTKQYSIATISGELYINAAKTKVEGVNVTNNIWICAQEVMIERCRFNRIYSSGNNAQLATIRQCWGGPIYGQGATNSNTYGWVIEGCRIGYSSNDNVIQRLYMAKINNCYCTITYQYYFIMADLQDCVITNNIIHRAHNTNYNECLGGLTNCTVQNNILSCGEGTYPKYDALNTCIGSSDFSSVIVINGDDKFSLVEGSPALNAGIDGTDIGPTGGQFPYVSGGQPYGLPWYSFSQVASAPSDGKVKVNLQIRVQNE